MRVLLQRVKSARVLVDQKITGEIDIGWLALIGVSEEDDQSTVEKVCRKIITLRCFADENGKSNLSIEDVEGEILAVSQFTLYANYKKGRRPSFIEAASPEKAENLYEYAKLQLSKYVPVKSGVFGADMSVTLENNGPYTIILDSQEMG